ncbi:MAG: phosphomannomutase / phosphoglucomutase [Candidatus Peregrinibacteria bacterium Gr01-1014_25]|nr:MAG: phosphomannomutase / phosphoglucomutase [Candidatus Peregrinibacteria bacterium Gr01-1014_25]
MPIDPSIFRAYDIRGVAHEQITEEACRAVGQAFGTVLRRMYGIGHPRVAVGRDARTHGPLFERAVVDGLVSSGCHVLLIGATPSPVNYFAVCNGKLDGSIQVTASHNPPTDNGLKLQIRDAHAFAGNDLQTLREQIEKRDVLTGEGSREEENAASAYVEHHVRAFAGAGQGQRIVVDGGNGIAGPVNCSVLKGVGATITELFIEPDGAFPNHPADPSKHDTLRWLQERVRADKAAVGFAFDGDGDRLGVVDDQGKILTADEVLLLLARDHLSRHPGGRVVCTVSNSGTILTEVRHWGGEPVMCKVGHSFVEHAMREHGALLGGEQSGHFFCGEDSYGYDDALVAALRVLKILQSDARPLSSIREDFPRVYQAHERRPRCPDDTKADVVRRVTEHFAKTHPVETMDGARIDFGDDAWAGIRQSNTSPRLSICIEARSPEKLAAVEKEVLGHLETYEEIDFRD